jgi:hypothetical protein
MVSSLSHGLHPDAGLINAPILEAPQDQHPSQQDINEITQSVSYLMNVKMSWSLTNTLLLLAQSKEGGNTHYSKDLKISVVLTCLVLVACCH